MPAQNSGTLPGGLYPQINQMFLCHSRSPWLVTHILGVMLEKKSAVPVSSLHITVNSRNTNKSIITGDRFTIESQEDTWIKCYTV